MTCPPVINQLRFLRDGSKDNGLPWNAENTLFIHLLRVLDKRGKLLDELEKLSFDDPGDLDMYVCIVLYVHIHLLGLCEEVQ